mmetsp:Transcript_11473/g.13685  ORF Transcript_11473/g.13685 Transcript_11473/m.13685 type:complete len:97 (+) Transcript_11473:138-428(+)
MPSKNKKKDKKDYTATVTDMPTEIQDFALETALKALEDKKSENETVALVKEAFDRKYGPTWHCIIGRNFGSKVTHESKTFLYVKLNQQLKMLVFKS